MFEHTIGLSAYIGIYVLATVELIFLYSIFFWVNGCEDKYGFN